ncbi:MAG: PcfJ domain-containing protein [Pseudomonadota bacterium]
MFVKNQSNQLVEFEIARFPKVYRRRLRRLVSGSAPLSDLLVSFPAAAFALVSGFGTVDGRGNAVALIKAGASLKAVSEVLGLPFWARKLPPEAFAAPIGDLPSDADFGRRMMNQLPKDNDVTDLWLGAVLEALRVGDQPFALWVAGQKKLSLLDHPLRPAVIWLLAAFAWASRNDQAAGFNSINKRWSKGTALKTAQRAAAEWALRLIAEAERQPAKRGPGRYSLRNRQAGYAVVVLQTAAELNEEGRLMNHCVGTYANEVARGHCLIFGIRRDGHRVATMEVRCSRNPEALPHIAQLQGPGNSRVSAEVRERVRMWLLQHASDPVGGADTDAGTLLTDPKKWRALWAPHQDAVPAAFPGGQVPKPSEVRHVAMLLQQMAGW